MDKTCAAQSGQAAIVESIVRSRDMYMVKQTVNASPNVLERDKN